MSTHDTRVVIIGAGISGLAAARVLHDAGCVVTVLEKNSEVGGRITTQKIEGLQSSALFDCGAQNIKSQGTPLEEWANRVLASQRVFIKEPVNLHDNNGVFPGDETSNTEPKWSCQNGMATLPQTLAQGLDVQFCKAVERIEEKEEFNIVCKDGGNFASDLVIVSTPAPVAAQLLENSRWTREENINSRIEKLQTVEYSHCLSVQLWFENWQANFDWYALLARDRSHPLLWISYENRKGFAEQGTALIAQLGPQTSLELWGRDDEAIVQQTQVWLRELIACDSVPTRFSVVRWEHSLPKNCVSFDEVNPANTRVFICGDGTARGRVTDAYESGLRAAQRVLSTSL